MNGFWETAERLGADANPYRAGFAQQICVAETDAQAEKDYFEHVTYFFNKCLHVPGYFMETPGYRTRRSAEFAIKSGTPADIIKAATLEKSWKTLVDNGFIIAGSPDTVADRLIEASQRLRVGNLIALLQIGSMSHELTKKNLTLFAEGVMPKIRGLWQSEGWEHRWWPQGARQDVPATPAAPAVR
jgi:alkanesulfonate monooxygenase SsuD/methylene tetrahydromethanopterin reductase-like flavin-dependent oxidoreductase (luciferase family)